MDDDLRKRRATTIPCTKCGQDKPGMFCDECGLPHCDDCGSCPISTPRIWQDVLEDLEGFPLDLVTPTVEALRAVRDTELETARASIARVRALHRIHWCAVDGHKLDRTPNPCTNNGFCRCGQRNPCPTLEALTAGET